MNKKKDPMIHWQAHVRHALYLGMMMRAMESRWLGGCGCVGSGRDVDTLCSTPCRRMLSGVFVDDPLRLSL